MATVNYRQSKRTTSGKAEFLIRMNVSRTVSIYAKSGIYASVGIWNDKEQRMSYNRKYVTAASLEAARVNKELEELRAYILDRYTEETADVNAAWLDNVIAKYHGANNYANITLERAIDMYIDASELSQSSVQTFNQLQGLLKQFRPLIADKVTYTDIEAFDKFVSERVGHNTRILYLNRLRTICKWLVRTQIAKSNPFDTYRIKTPIYGTPTFLTIEERNAIYAHKGLSKALSIQRDIFIFQCCIGCRVSDLIRLTPDSVTEDGMIQYIQQKMRTKLSDTIRVPLNNIAKEIIERYKNYPLKRNKLLPFITVSIYNNAIKSVLKQCGITRPVLVQDPHTMQQIQVPICDVATSHLARRTFMANIYKATRSERIVSSFTGHKNGSMAMRRYTVVDDEMKRNIIDEIEGEI